MLPCEATNYGRRCNCLYDDIDVNVTYRVCWLADHLTFDSKAEYRLTTETEIADSLTEGQKGTVFCRTDSFFAQLWVDQEGDTGVIGDQTVICCWDTPIKAALGSKFWPCRTYGVRHDHRRRDSIPESK